MAKIEVNQVAEILKKHKLEPALLREIVEAMNEVTTPAAGEDTKPPTGKKQFVIILSKASNPVAIALRTVLDQVDYVAKNCSPTNMVSAVLETAVISMARDALAKPDGDQTGWVVQIPENASPFSTMDRIHKASYDFNASKKGRLLPVKSVGESLESTSAKYFKEAELWVKTKMPVAVVVTNNVLPKDEFKVEKVDKRRRTDE